MVTEEDCSCADTTEPSNLTSLHSDDATISAVNSDINAVCTETVAPERSHPNGAVEKPKGIFANVLRKQTICIKRLK